MTNCVRFILAAVAAGTIATAVGQTAYRGVTPGATARSEAERMLGRPLRAITPTLAEYASGKEEEKIFVQYRKDSPVVERLDSVYPAGLDRAILIRTLRLGSGAGTSERNAGGRLVEYYVRAAISLLYSGPNESAKVTRVSFCSRELIGSLSRGVPPQSQSAHSVPTPAAALPSAAPRPAPGISTAHQPSRVPNDTAGEVGGFVVSGQSGAIEMSARPGEQVRQGGRASSSVPASGAVATRNAGSGSPCFVNPGAASRNRASHLQWASGQNAAKVMSNLMQKTDAAAECLASAPDAWIHLFGEVSVIVARAVPDARCFDGDTGAINRNLGDHMNFARNGRNNPAKIVNNLKWKIAAAMACLDKPRSDALFADISVVLATSVP